jgi:hypothetical protein
MCSVCSSPAKALLGLYSGYLPSAQVKAAAAHVHRLKRNRRKKISIPSIYGIYIRRSRVDKVHLFPADVF